MEDAKKIYKALNRAIRMRNKYYHRWVSGQNKTDREQWDFACKKCRYLAGLVPAKVLFHCENINLAVR